jgi:hypothetical protein
MALYTDTFSVTVGTCLDDCLRSVDAIQVIGVNKFIGRCGGGDS